MDAEVVFRMKADFNYGEAQLKERLIADIFRFLNSPNIMLVAVLQL